MTRELIGIIGGTGKMGRAFARFFEERGHKVLIAGRKTELTPSQLAEQADIVIICVPIGSTLATIAEVGTKMRPDALLMDFTSLKTNPLEAMLKAFPGAVLGAHPVFGPSNVVPGQTIVLCPGRHEKWFERMKEILGDFRLLEMSANDHDSRMALVQGLQHFFETAFAATTAKIGIPLQDLLDVASPVYQVQIDLVGRIIGHDADLYAEIVYGTKPAREAIETFIAVCEKIFAEEKPGFVEAFKAGKAFFGDYTEVAQKKSDEIIFRLAAHEAEELSVFDKTETDLVELGALGPAFTWSDLAASAFFPDKSLRLFPSFPDIFTALLKGEVKYALLPIENKISGAIRTVWEDIAKNGLWIESTYDFPIAHVLAARDTSDIHAIFSHEQSLAQCRKFLENTYPKVRLIPTASNSEAVRRAASTTGAAAICSMQAAQKARFLIIHTDLADRKDNITRFALIRQQRESEKLVGQKLTTIVFELKNEAGSMLSVLKILADKNINMVRLESVPTGRNFSEYAFYIDFEGGMSAEISAILAEKTLDLKILGHYSVFPLPTP